MKRLRGEEEEEEEEDICDDNDEPYPNYGRKTYWTSNTQVR